MHGAMQRSHSVLRVEPGQRDDDSGCRCACRSSTVHAEEEEVLLPRLLRRDYAGDTLLLHFITFALGLFVLLLLLRITARRRRTKPEQVLEDVAVQREKEIEVLRKWMESKGEEFFRPVWDKLGD